MRTLAEAEGHAADLHQVVARAFSEVAPRAAIRATNTIPTYVPNVLGGEEQLVVVVGNLLRNSVAAINKKGSGKLWIDAETTQDKKWVLLRVCDTGNGIPKKLLDELNGRRHNARHKGEGLGLGVWLARTYVQLLGGELRLDSKRKKSTTVTIMLPSHRSFPRLDSSG